MPTQRIWAISINVNVNVLKVLGRVHVHIILVYVTIDAALRWILCQSQKGLCRRTTDLVDGCREKGRWIVPQRRRWIFRGR